MAAKIGRPMTLRRKTLSGTTQTNTDVTVMAWSRDYDEGELVAGAGVMQGDTEVKLSNKEIAAAAWPAPPKKGDMLIFDSRNTIIQGVEQRYLGTALIAYVCHVRG